MPVRVGSNSSKSKVNCLSNSKLNLEELFKDIEYLNSAFCLYHYISDYYKIHNLFLDHGYLLGT